MTTPRGPKADRQNPFVLTATSLGHHGQPQLHLELDDLPTAVKHTFDGETDDTRP